MIGVHDNLHRSTRITSRERMNAAFARFPARSQSHPGFRFNPSARLDTSQVDDRRPDAAAIRRYGGVESHLSLDYRPWRKTRPG